MYGSCNFISVGDGEEEQAASDKVLMHTHVTKVLIRFRLLGNCFVLGSNNSTLTSFSMDFGFGTLNRKMIYRDCYFVSEKSANA